MLLDERIREDFPVLSRTVNGKSLIYFDNAATSQKPIQVIEAMAEFYKTYYANVHRGIHTLSQEASERYEEAHEKVAEFVGARGMKEIVFTRNATEALNAVAYGWALRRLGEGDEILLTVAEHHSNIVPWQMVAELTGAKIVFAGIDEDGVVTVEEVESKISRRTKIVSVAHVSNVLGTKNPVEEIGKLAHDHGAIFVVDAAQSVPHCEVDVKKIDADFLAFSGHKMLGPTGIGVLYGKEELLDQMPPFLGGGGMISEVTTEGFKPASLPWKFEAGTPSIVAAIGLAAAVDYLSRMGMDKVEAHEKELARRIQEGLQALDGVKVYGPKDPAKREGIVSFTVKGACAHDIATLLDLHGIAIRSGHHCAQPLHRALGVDPECGTARASVYIYNTAEEVERFLSVMEEIVEALRL